MDCVLPCSIYTNASATCSVLCFLMKIKPHNDKEIQFILDDQGCEHVYMELVQRVADELGLLRFYWSLRQPTSEFRLDPPHEPMKLGPIICSCVSQAISSQNSSLFEF